MKSTSLVMLAGTLLLSGCGQTTSSESQPTSTGASTRTAITVSQAATCQTLLGSDGGLISESGTFLTDVSELSNESAAQAGDIADALEGVAETSGAEIRDLLRVMEEPFRDLVEAHESGSSFELEPSRFKAAANEVIALCEKEEARTAPAAAAPAKTNTPVTKTYRNIDELHAAYVAAGGVCEGFFKPQLRNVLPVETGKCGTETGATVMYRFFTVDKRDQFIANVQAVSPAAGIPVHLVVGDTWVLDATDAAAVAPKLGGTLVTE